MFDMGGKQPGKTWCSAVYESRVGGLFAAGVGSDPHNPAINAYNVVRSFATLSRHCRCSDSTYSVCFSTFSVRLGGRDGALGSAHGLFFDLPRPLVPVSDT
jgi:hypothetical protein